LKIGYIGSLKYKNMCTPGFYGLHIYLRKIERYHMIPYMYLTIVGTI